MAVLLGSGIFLLTIELGLRVFGFGYPTSFLLPVRTEAGEFWTQNPKFGWRFFGRQMARAPHPIYLSKTKPPNTVRIFVFGESAAFGDPLPAFGLSRMLQALLEAHYPGTNFEVVNAAMTGINSHVIRSIAADCAQASGDLWVIYMGNNEVVGPFGAGTVFGGKTPPLPLIRLSLWIKSTRIGQLVENLLSRRAPTREWGGMAMFLNHQVSAADPRLERVYTNFGKNLNQIIELGTHSGAAVIVSTVGSNLKDCPPFASLHGEGLSAAQLAEWSTVWGRATAAKTNGDPKTLGDLCAAAAALDNQYADVRFLRGEASLAAGNFQNARQEFVAARDLDALRFRCDTPLNEITRKASQDRTKERVWGADGEAALAKSCQDAIPGEQLFYDHVHLTFEGNYELALTIAEQAEKVLSPSAGASKQPWLSAAQCAERLAWSPFAHRTALLDMFGRVSEPPFTSRMNHAANVAQLRQRIAQLAPASSAASIAANLERAEAIMAQHKQDEELSLQVGLLAEAAGATNKALIAAESAVHLAPTSNEAWARYAAALEKTGRLAESATAYRKVIELDPDAFYAWNNLGRVLADSGRQAEAQEAFRTALKIKPGLGPAWLSLGQLFAASGKQAEAEECFAQALTNRIRSANELNRLAEFCRERGWHLAAATNYADAVSLNPGEISAYLRAGQSFAAAGQDPQAQHYFMEGVQVAPDFGPAHFVYGQYLGRNGRADAAEQEFRAAVRLMPNVAEARLNLALSLANQGRLEESIAEYETVLKQWPANVTAQQHLARLRAATKPHE